MNMMKVKNESVDVELVGGAKNLTVAIKVTRPDGSGLGFTLTPFAARVLADKILAQFPGDDDE